MKKVSSIVKCLVLLSALGFADSLNVVVGNALSPWVIPSEDRGIILDILRESLEPASYQVSFSYVPYARRFKTYELDKSQVLCDIRPENVEELKLDGFMSEVILSFENIAVTLQEHGYQIESVEDLAELSVVGWKGAHRAMGEEYQKMAEKNENYQEMNDQQIQVRLLFAGRVDVIQLDRQIFKYFRMLEHKKAIVNVTKEVDIFPIFNERPTNCLFKQKKWRDDFNIGLRQLRESGRYEEILKRYSMD